MWKVCTKIVLWYKLCLCSGNLALRAFNRGITSVGRLGILLFITMQHCLRSSEIMQEIIKIIMDLSIINKRSLADKNGETAIQIGMIAARLQK